MKLRTLLLSSAAAVVVVGGAQAADLSIAEPVESVRVCDAFGTGYWYIPGTETCIAIHGSVEFDVNFHDLSEIYVNTAADPSAHSSNWNFVTTAKLNITAKSVTDYGDLVGYIGMRGDYNNDTNDENLHLDDAWLSLGPLLAGHTGSTYDFGKSYADGAYFSRHATDQIRLSWAMGGFGIMLGIEDPIDRWGSSLAGSYNMPDFVAAITASQASWSGKLSVGVAQLSTLTAYGVGGILTFKLDSIAPGDEMYIEGAFGNGSYVSGGPGIPNGFPGATLTSNSNWAANIGFLHNWSAVVSSGLDVGYLHNAGTAPSNQWSVGANLVWAPVSGFSAKLQGNFVQVSGGTSTWTGQVALTRSW